MSPPYSLSHTGHPKKDEGVQEELPNFQIDCEMTGLNAFEDKIIEIAVIITNGHLEPVDEGIEFIIKTDKNILDK